MGKLTQEAFRMALIHVIAKNLAAYTHHDLHKYIFLRPVFCILLSFIINRIYQNYVELHLLQQGYYIANITTLLVKMLTLVLTQMHNDKIKLNLHLP